MITYTVVIFSRLPLEYVPSFNSKIGYFYRSDAKYEISLIHALVIF